MTQTTTIGSSAWAQGRDAVQDATEAAVAGLGGAPPALVLLFPDARSPANAALERAAAAAPGARLAGMTGDGVLTTEGIRADGCEAVAFGPGVSVGVGLAERASEDLRAAGRTATERAVADAGPLEPGYSVVLLFIDPLSGDQAEVIDGAYSVTGGMIPLAGGGANGREPGVLADGVMRRDAVVAVVVSSERPITVSTAHGCRPMAAPAIATRTAGRAVLELDGRPAEDVYLEALGHVGPPLDDDAFEALAVLHPLGQPELRGQLRLRHIMRRHPGGGLWCATTIPPNAAVWPTEQTAATIIASAREAAQEAVDGIGCTPGLALVFDCAARRRALGMRVHEEGDALAEGLGATPALGGLFTRGEVGRIRGAKGDRNHAIVVVAFA